MELVLAVWFDELAEDEFEDESLVVCLLNDPVDVVFHDDAP